jgi:hypothetical protein
MQIGDLVRYNWGPLKNKGLNPFEKIGLIIAKKETLFGIKYNVQWDSGISQWYDASSLIIINEMGRKPKQMDS